MKRVTKFGFDHAIEGNSTKALWLFGLLEAVVAMLQSSDWMHEYIWAVRILPFVALTLSHLKLLFKDEIVGGAKVAEVRSEDPDAEVVITNKDKNEKDI